MRTPNADAKKDDVIACDSCGKDCSSHFYMCDIIKGEWCPDCFTKTSCGAGQHDEGCHTAAYSDSDENRISRGAASIEASPVVKWIVVAFFTAFFVGLTYGLQSFFQWPWYVSLTILNTIGIFAHAINTK